MKDYVEFEDQRWLWDGIFWGSPIPIPGSGDEDFSFWARSKNSRGKIPKKFPVSGLGIRDFWGLGIFYPRDFFLGMGYLTKKPPLFEDLAIFESLRYTSIFSKTRKIGIFYFQVSKPKNFSNLPDILKCQKTVETHLGLFNPIFSDFQDLDLKLLSPRYPNCLNILYIPKFKILNRIPRIGIWKMPFRRKRISYELLWLYLNF